MHYKKFILPLLSSILLLGACGTKSAEQPSNKHVIKTASENSTLTKEGIFNGLADSHTIEVTVDKKPLELQVKDELQSNVNSLADGDSIQFEYSVNKNKQNELIKIEKVNK